MGARVKKRYQGRGAHRYKDNPLEAAFAAWWQEQNEKGKTLAFLMDVHCTSGRPIEPADIEHEVAATVIQWLCSPVGSSELITFLLSKKAAPILTELLHGAAKGTLR